jgi:hypothetical protein
MKYENLILISVLILMPNLSFAGLELVCKGRQPQSNHKAVYVNCSDRKEFVETLGSAWRTLRKNYIGGTTEDLCWEAYNDAKDIHPSISFNNISDSFLMRCNMGLAYVK